MDSAARIAELEKRLELYLFALLRIKSNLELLGKELSNGGTVPPAESGGGQAGGRAAGT